MKYSLHYRSAYLEYIWADDVWVDIYHIEEISDIENIVYFDSIKSVYEQIVNDVFNDYRTRNLWGHGTYDIYNGEEIEKGIYIGEMINSLSETMLCLIAYQSSNVINEWFLNKIIKKYGL